MTAQIDKRPAAIRMVLSNPMDLTVVAQMLTQAERPDLLRLQEQQFRLVAVRFRRSALREFPLATFAESVYAMRLSGEARLPGDTDPAIVSALASQKMVFVREDASNTQRWSFRHDKIMEFFVLQTFLGPQSTRPSEHLEDPRFRGVYFLMAMQLPLEAAKLLREELILRAAHTNDHSVSDRFVQLLESRKAVQRGGPPWLDRYRLPAERQAAAELDALVRETVDKQAAVEQQRDLAQKWSQCRSILMEVSEEVLLQRSAMCFEGLGARVANRTSGQLCVVVKGGSGRTFVVSAMATPSAADEEAVSRALLAARQAAPSDSPAKVLVVANAHPKMDPAERTSWVDEAGARAAVASDAAIVTTVALLGALALGQSGADLEPVWAALATAAGIFRLPEEKVTRSA